MTKVYRQLKRSKYNQPRYIDLVWDSYEEMGAPNAAVCVLRARKRASAALVFGRLLSTACWCSAQLGGCTTGVCACTCCGLTTPWSVGWNRGRVSAVHAALQGTGGDSFGIHVDGADYMQLLGMLCSDYSPQAADVLLRKFERGRLEVSSPGPLCLLCVSVALSFWASLSLSLFLSLSLSGLSAGLAVSTSVSVSLPLCLAVSSFLCSPL